MADAVQTAQGLASIQPPNMNADILAGIQFDWGIVAIAGVLLGCSLVLGILYNSRYPQKLFLVYDNGVFRFMKFRTSGNRIMDDNLLAILFNKQKLCEDITSFKRRFLIGRGDVYLAAMVHRVLIPMDATMEQVEIKYDDKNMMKEVKGKLFIQPTEIWNGKQVAMRYIENEEFSEAQGKTVEPLTASLMMALPFILVLVVFMGGMYLQMSELNKAVSNTAQLQTANAQFEIYNTERIENLTAKLGYTSGALPAKYNATAK